MLTQRNESAGEYLTRAQVAKALQVSERTVDRYITEGLLPAKKLPGGRLVRIARADVAALAEGGDAA